MITESSFRNIMKICCRNSEVSNSLAASLIQREVVRLRKSAIYFSRPILSTFLSRPLISFSFYSFYFSFRFEVFGLFCTVSFRALRAMGRCTSHHVFFFPRRICPWQETFTLTRFTPCTKSYCGPL